MDKTVVHAPGEVAVLTLPGAMGKQVMIESVILRREGERIYEIMWFDDGIKTCFVHHDDLEDVPSQVISLCKFNEGN